MARQTINTGTPNGGNGDALRTAFEKVNQNFAELYSAPLLESLPETCMFYVLVPEGDGFVPRRVALSRVNDENETFYLTDNAGNILTDDSGNRLLWT